MSNVPKLRFSEFGGEWEEKKLGAVTTYVDYRGRAPIKTENGNFLVTAKNIKKGFIDYECSKEYVSEDNYLNVMSKGLPEIGDVLFTTEAPMGNVAQVDIENIALAQRVIKFRAKKMLLNSYLFHYMLSNIFQSLVTKKSIGTTVQGISGKELHQTKLAFPSLQEQEKIASFLTSVDTRIEQLTKKEALLQEYKKGVMNKIFNQEIRFKDDDGREFPKWEEEKISNLFLNIGGTALEKFTDENASYKFISIGNYSRDGKYIDNGQRIILNDKTETKLLEKDNLVMVLNDKTSTGDIIGSTILIDEDNKYIYNQRSERLICKKNISSLFYWHFFNSKLFRKEVFSISQGGTQIYINFSAIKLLNIPLPSLKEQTKIANFLSSIDKKIELITKELNSTKEFKKALLQQMFV